MDRGNDMPKIVFTIDKALEKAKKIRTLEKEEKKKEEGPQERTIYIDAGELGFDSAKVGEDDLVKLQFTGRVKQKMDGKFLVSVDNIIVPKKEPEAAESDIMPSPSA